MRTTERQRKKEQQKSLSAASAATAAALTFTAAVYLAPNCMSVRSLRAVVCARTALPSGSSTVVVERVAARDARSVLRWRRRVPPILAAIVRLRAHVSIAAAAPLSLPSRPGLRVGRSDSRLSLLSILFFFLVVS